MHPQDKGLANGCNSSTALWCFKQLGDKMVEEADRTNELTSSSR